jgi:hypothetical protein
MRIPRDETYILTAANLHGWQASVNLRFGQRVGLVFDFAGNYGQRRKVASRLQPFESDPGDVSVHTILLGPQIRVLQGERVDINVRTLIGAAYVGTLVLPLREPLVLPPPPGVPAPPPLTEYTIGASKPVTGVLGGSIDYRITDAISYRIVQPELVVTSLGSTNERNFRVSTGIVLKFGGP